MDDKKLREALEHIIRGNQANVDHLSGDARLIAKRLNQLIDEVAAVYEILGIEVDADSGASSSVIPASHDELEDVSANDHHNQSHTQTDHDRAETGDLAAVAAAAGAGTSTEVPNADHVHAHGTGYTGAHSDAVNDGDTAGGELGGTYPNPTVNATHSGSTHSAATDTHIADGTDAHDASAISIADAGNDFTATDVEGALDELQADNEAHVAAADPHSGYRLESADHSHASTGAQAGQLDHGAALTGLTDDDHPQYMLESLIDAVGDLIVGSADNTPARLPKGTDGQILYTDSGETLDLKWDDPPAGGGGGSGDALAFFLGGA